MKLIVLLAFLILGETVTCIDLKGAEETKCFKIERTVSPNQFLSSVNGPLYLPIISRLDLYSLVRDLLPQPPEEIIEGAMYYDGCILFSVNSNGTLTSQGFNGRTREYVTFELSTGVSRYQPAKGSGFSGTLYTTLTDNKTFAVFPFCFDNGQMSWCTLSTLPELPPATKELIHKHVKSLGFSEEYFTEMRYGQCDNAPSQHGWSKYYPAKAEEPCNCLLNYEPVCGSDGKTYGNICELNCAKKKNPDLVKVSDGACKKR